MATQDRKPRILAIDAGGTMTDTIIIDEAGEFVVGKAQTTPEDESEGFAASVADATRYWETTPEATMPELVSGIYSGTAMLNRLLERKGRRVGCIVTAGMEDYLRLERGIQTYLGYSYSDRVHVVTHRHNEPLVPRDRMKGATERVDVFGAAVIPLYEDEVRDAARELLKDDVEAICISFIFSYRNPAHEQRAEEIVGEVMKEMGKEVDVYRSSDRYPLRPDFPRLNTLLIEAYAAEPSREHLQRVRTRARDAGAHFDVRIMASHGGTISIDARELAKTLISGPIGGVIGGRYLAERLGTGNLVCTDIGGTSFDLALITDSNYHIKNIPDIGRFLLNIPMVQIDSVKPTIFQAAENPDAPVAYMGILGPVPVSDPQVQFQLDPPVEEGVVIQDVVPGGPADRAGIQPGDIVVEFDGESIATDDDLVSAIRSHDPRDEVEVEVVHEDGSRDVVTVTLGVNPVPTS